MSTLFLELISILVSGMYFLFLLFVNTRCDHELIKSETLGKLRKYQSLMEMLHRLGIPWWLVKT